MLAPLVLPFQITCIIFAVLWVAGAILLRTPKRIAWLSLAAMLLFIPSCTGVMAVVDLQRYGRFDYSNASEIANDGYIELPPIATNVTIYRNSARHWAKFTIDTQSLRSWIEERRALQPSLNQNHDNDEWLPKDTETQRPEITVLSDEIFRNRFPDTGRGGGYTVWHVASTGDTYLSAGYW
jgi:hypothetical protein